MAADRSRLAAALAYRQAEEERRRRMLESIPTPAGTTPAQPAPQADFRTNLENLSIGVGEGLTNQLEGIKGLVTDPIGTAKGVYEAGKAVVRDPAIIASALRQMGQKAMSGPLGAGEVMGEMVSPTRGAGGVGKRDIFIGKSARTWDASAAKRAEELEAAGVEPENIWRETGTFRGPDGQLRQEIPDAMAFKPTVGTPEANTRFWNVNEAVLHPAMRKAYPEMMEETLTTIERKPFAESGFYQAKVPRTDETVGLDPELYVAARDRGSIKSILAHELQHAVQEAEGFAKGGSPRMFEKGVALSERGRGVLEDLRDSLGSGSLTSPREIVDNFKYFREGELERIAAKHKFKTVDELQKFLKEETLQRDPVEQYKRLAGEAEARATQARRGMTMEQRRAKFPYESYDVPIEELIIRR